MQLEHMSQLLLCLKIQESRVMDFNYKLELVSFLKSSLLLFYKEETNFLFRKGQNLDSFDYKRRIYRTSLSFHIDAIPFVEVLKVGSDVIVSSLNYEKDVAVRFNEFFFDLKTSIPEKDYIELENEFVDELIRRGVKKKNIKEELKRNPYLYFLFLYQQTIRKYQDLTWVK